MSSAVTVPHQQERAKETRRKIVGAATDLWAEKGIGVKVEEITAAAGVSKGAFYFHFKKLDDLFPEVKEALASSPDLSDFQEPIKQLLENPKARLLFDLTEALILSERGKFE